MFFTSLNVVKVFADHLPEEVVGTFNHHTFFGIIKTLKATSAIIFPSLQQHKSRTETMARPHGKHGYAPVTVRSTTQPH